MAVCTVAQRNQASKNKQLFQRIGPRNILQREVGLTPISKGLFYISRRKAD